MFDEQARLWIDVGPLFRHKGNVSGIQRVAICVIREWLSAPGLPLRFCGYEPGHGHFHEIARPPVEELIAQWLKSPSPAPEPKPSPAPVPKPAAIPPALRGWKRVARAVYQRLPEDARAGLWHLYQAARSFSRLVRPRTMLDPTSEVSKTSEVGAIAAPVPPPAPFRAGDALFLPLNSWGARCIDPVLAGLSDRRGVRLVPLLYDVIPLSQPHLVHPRKRDRYAGWVDNLLPRCAVIVTISQNSRREVLDQVARIGQPAPPVKVVRLGDEIPRPIPPRRPRELPSHVGEGFVLSLGSICPRKNQQLLYQAWRVLLERHGPAVPPLVLVGRAEAMSEVLLLQMRNDPLLRQHLIILEGPPDAETEWLLANCRFTMFPSLYEGWGLPVAEGLAHGKYCVCSGASSLPEIGGDLLDYHDPLDLPACLELVERALFTPGFLAERERRIRKRFRVTSWEACAGQILRIVQTHGLSARPPFTSAA